MTYYYIIILPLWVGSFFGRASVSVRQDVVIETGDGWHLEAKIPLEPFGISVANGVKIGFNIHYNDDDDGADTRESKLNWSENDDNDNSYTNPQKLAELVFVNANLAIQPNGKLASTWGIIRLSQ